MSVFFTERLDVLVEDVKIDLISITYNFFMPFQIYMLVKCRKIILQLYVQQVALYFQMIIIEQMDRDLESKCGP